MQTRRQNPFTTVRTEGAILPADLLQRVAGGTGDSQIDPPQPLTGYGGLGLSNG
jgi:hypothetical protein